MPSLSEFREYLADLGLASGSIEVYERDMRVALNDRGVLARLKESELAPKTLRHILTAGRHWADFTEDLKLSKALKRIRLPPARRKGIRVPLEKPDLLELLDELKRSSLRAPVRAVIGLMAMRGLRIGDILRMEREQVHGALSSGQLVFQAKGRKFLSFKVISTFRQHLQQLADCKGTWGQVMDLVSPHAKRARLKAAKRAVERALKEISVACGIFGNHPHRLRRTYAVEYVRQLKGDPEALEKLRQHQQWSTIATALEYIDHARGEELDDPAQRIFEGASAPDASPRRRP